ncbi:universal stress protein [bacterium]|nr:universal stress protein [bacterium]
MTMPALQSIGLCVHYSPQGDWAFDFALRLVRERDIQFNIFHFLADPFNPNDHPPQNLGKKELDDLIVERERELRFYYDDRLGDHLKAGFRLCEDNEWSELHHCLLRREFQLLVMPYPEAGATFGRRNLEEFASNFVSPIVLVGPNHPDEIHLNTQAVLLNDIHHVSGASGLVLSDG